MAETTATTRPAPRRRTTPKTTDGQSEAVQAATPNAPAKPRTRATKAPEAVAQAVDTDGREVYAFDLTFTRETKSYAVFTAPKGSGCVGSLYFPLGTREARVRFTGGPAA